MPASGSLQALAMIWDQPNQGGPSGSGNCQVVGTGGPNIRYDRWDYDALYDVGLASKISSVSLFASLTGATVLILYSYGDYVHSYQNATHFDSDFLLIDNRSGTQFDLNLATRQIGDGNWNNCPTSLIVVHTAQGPEIRLSAKQTLTPIWNGFIDQQLAQAGGKVTRDGNPTWTWIAFPKQMEHLNSNQNYLRVTQKVIVSPPAPIADYEAQISYYLRLVPANGTVGGWVQRWEYWVESGMFSEYVGAVLRPYTILGSEKLNDLLAAGGLPLPPGISVVTRLYYLPGVQTDATQPGEVQIFQGWSGDDATIVLQTG